MSDLKIDKEYIDAVASANNMEPAEVEEMYIKAYETVSSLPGVKGKPIYIVERRAKAQLSRMIANRRRAGEPFIFTLLAPIGRVRDWNEPIFKYNEEMCLRNPRQLIAEGRVFTIEKDGKTFIVKKINAYERKPVVVEIESGKIVDVDPEEVKDNDSFAVIEEFVVTDGEIWDPKVDRDEYPLWRDNTIINDNLSSVNWGYGKPLTHNYRMNLLGFGHPLDNDEDIRLIDITVGGDAANPDSDNFLLKKIDLFRFYKGEFTVLEKKMDGVEHKFYLRYDGNMPTPHDVGAEPDEVIPATITQLKEKFNDHPEIPDFIDGAAGLIEFHENNISRDENGNIIRSKSGYEYIPWYKIAVAAVYVDRIIEPKSPDGKPFFSITDALMSGNIMAYADDSMFKFPNAGKIPGLYLISCKTMRSPYRYDRTLRQRVVAEDGKGELRLTLFGMMSLERVGEMEAAIEEEGDL